MLASSSIYTFFPYGSTTQYLYMVILSLADGSASSRRKSSISFNYVYVYGSGVSGDCIAASLLCSITSYLLIFNKATNVFSIRSFTGTYLLGIGLEPSTNRLVVEGWVSGNGYSTKFTIQSISAHPDFQTPASWTMNILPSGTDDIVAESGQSIGAVSPQTVSAPSPAYTNLTVTYVPGASYTSDVNFQTNDQSFSILESITTTKTPYLPCSISGSTSISFSIGSYLTSAPSWVTIDSTSGILFVTAPEVFSDTEFDFYINSAVSGFPNPFQKLIKLTILNCAPSNCQK